MYRFRVRNDVELAGDDCGSVCSLIDDCWLVGGMDGAGGPDVWSMEACCVRCGAGQLVIHCVRCVSRGNATINARQSARS